MKSFDPMLAMLNEAWTFNLIIFGMRLLDSILAALKNSSEYSTFTSRIYWQEQSEKIESNVDWSKVN